MFGVDESRTFRPLRLAVLTLSDTRTLETDSSGQYLVDAAAEAGHAVVRRALIPDDVDALRATLTGWIADPEVEVVLTTGGTGITRRDITPEVARSLFDKEIEGFGEMFRWVSLKTVGTSTIQSRAVGGVAGGTLIFCLPGSTGACRDAWTNILVFQLDSRHRPCNFPELLHRL